MRDPRRLIERGGELGRALHEARQLREGPQLDAARDLGELAPLPGDLALQGQRTLIPA